MKKFLQELAFVLLVLTGLFPVAGQDLSGYWQGMDYGPRPNEVTFWPTTLKLAQTGNTINGSCFQQVTSQTPYFVEWKISGASVNTNVGQMQFAEVTALNVAESAPCASKYSFTYYPDEERLLGMREFTNNPCTSETGGVYAQAQGGYGKLTYALDEQPFRESGVFSDLQSGEYTLRVRDSLGCETTMVVKVADKNNAVVLQDVDVQHGRCGAEFGSVTVIATGTGELQYSLDGENYVTTPNFPRVIPGTYEVFVKDPGGCAANRKIFVDTAPAPEFLNIIEYNASCNGNDGSISVYATGRGPLLFSIDAVNYVPDTVFTGLSPLVQTVYMVDTAGCYVARSLYIREECLESVHIPTAFSPDLDGKNEVMELKFETGKLKIRHFRLFNRWGTVVASRSDQTVESGYALWDGLYKGGRLQPGAYPYELMIEFDDGRTRMIRDSIMLLR